MRLVDTVSGRRRPPPSSLALFVDVNPAALGSDIRCGLTNGLQASSRNSVACKSREERGGEAIADTAAGQTKRRPYSDR